MTFPTTAGRQRGAKDAQRDVGERAKRAHDQPPAPRASSQANDNRQNNQNSQNDQNNADVDGDRSAHQLDMEQLGAGAAQEFRVSPLRWLTLFGICSFGLLGGLSNESGSILNVYVEALGETLSNYMYLSQIFFLVPFGASFLAASLVDQFGAKLAIYTAVLFASVRNCGRALLFAPQVVGWRQLRLVYWASQRIFGQFTVAIYYCLPLRIAESWFTEEERSLALTLMLVSPALGTALASIIYPRIATSLASVMPLAYINLAAAALGLALVSASFHRSRPNEGSPNERNQLNLAKLREQNEAGESFWLKLGKILRNKQFMVQIVALNVFDPLVWTVQSILQDIFASAGLSSVFCGEFLAFRTMLGCLMQIGCSYLWRARGHRGASHAGGEPAAAHASEAGAGEKKRRRQDPFRTRECKLLMCFQCASFILFGQSLILHEIYAPTNWLVQHQWWILIITSTIYILIRYWANPYFNESTAELICGQISEPVASACQMIIWSLMSNICAVIFVRLRISPPDSKPSHLDLLSLANKRPPAATYKYSVLFVCLLGLTNTLFYLTQFKPRWPPRVEVVPPPRASIASSLHSRKSQTLDGCAAAAAADDPAAAPQHDESCSTKL